MSEVNPIELLPCPFCGRAPNMKQVPSQTVSANYWWVGCEITGSNDTRKLVGCGIAHSAWSESEAAAKWNTRAQSPVQPEWQPIESAPKDGTPVLLNWEWDSGLHKGETIVLERWYCRTHAHLSRATNCPNESDCKMGWGAYGGEMTGWMPLPPPKGDGKQ